MLIGGELLLMWPAVVAVSQMGSEGVHLPVGPATAGTLNGPPGSGRSAGGGAVEEETGERELDRIGEELLFDLTLAGGIGEGETRAELGSDEDRLGEREGDLRELTNGRVLHAELERRSLRFRSSERRINSDHGVERDEHNQEVAAQCARVTAKSRAHGPDCATGES